MWMLLLIWAALAQEPTYEQEISEKNRVKAETKEQDQKTFFEVINEKSQQVMRYARTSKDELLKKQEAIRKDFDKKLKAEIEEAKKKEAKENVETLRKAANEKRRELFEQLNTEKKTVEKQMEEVKNRFNSFVKVQKENFREQIRSLSVKAKRIKAVATESPIEQEFREIPPGPATQLKPQ